MEIQIECHKNNETASENRIEAYRKLLNSPTNKASASNNAEASNKSTISTIGYSATIPE